MKNDAFYEQLHPIQERLPKGDTVIVMANLNVMMVSDNIPFGHVMVKQGLGDRIG